VTRAVEELNRRMLRARDAIDRTYGQALDIPALAAVASVSEAHFIRTFKTTFGETPHRYLQRRRVERAMFLLRETQRNITDICLDVGFTILGTFSRTFREIVGVNPTDYRARGDVIHAPTCFTMSWMRPSSNRAILEKQAKLNANSIDLDFNHSGGKTDAQLDQHLAHIRLRPGQGP
jgi:AraC-like DNA-binding protein